METAWSGKRMNAFTIAIIGRIENFKNFELFYHMYQGNTLISDCNKYFQLFFYFFFCLNRRDRLTNPIAIHPNIFGVMLVMRVIDAMIDAPTRRFDIIS